MCKKNIILASSSTIHGSAFLAYLKDEIIISMDEIGSRTLLFIPFARPGGITHDAYTERVVVALQNTRIEVKSLHECEDMAQAIKEASTIYTGGGNTFLLLKTLYQHQLIAPLREWILDGGLYIGTSAGSNIGGLTVNNTNDMPIVWPPSLQSLGVVDYNINPHYLDPDPDSTHKGETRETRIAEFHQQQRIPVIGLREGSYLRIKANKHILYGPNHARLFSADLAPVEWPPETDFHEVLQDAKYY